MNRPEDEELFDSRSPPWVEQDEGVLPEAQLLADTTAVEEMLDAPEERIPQVAPRPEGDAGEQAAAEPAPAPRQTGREQPMSRQERMDRRNALRNQQNGVPMGQEQQDAPPLSREQRQQARARHRQQQAGVQQPNADAIPDIGIAPVGGRLAGPGGDPLAASPPRQQPDKVASRRRSPQEPQERQEGRRSQEGQEQSWRPPIFDQFQEVVAFDAGDEVPLGEPREVAREDPQVAMNDTMGLAEAAYQNSEVAAEQSRYLHNTMSRLRDTEVGFMSKNYV